MNSDSLVEYKSITDNGITKYYNGKGNLHRVDSPALIYPNGRREYYIDGKRHREGGPAIDDRPENSSLSPHHYFRSYYVDGKLHRVNGPAVIYPQNKFDEYTRAECWQNGKLHKIDGPAIINMDTSRHYYIDGKRHRTNGPAIIRPDGFEAYYIDGKLHRIDGPAIIHPNGTEEWYIDGNKVNGAITDDKLIDRTLDATTIHSTSETSKLAVDNPNCVEDAINLAEKYPKYKIKVIKNGTTLMIIESGIIEYYV